MSKEARGGPSTVLAMLGVLLVASAAALSSVVHPGERLVTNPNPTPYGYTISLSFFALPLLAVSGWLHRHGDGVARRAFWITLVILVPLGFVLDIALGLLFFTFPNPRATLGVDAWGWDWHVLRFVRVLPIEEFFFYSLGFGAILSTYVWFDEAFLSRYQAGTHAQHRGAIVRFDVRAVGWALGLSLLAMAYKKWGPHANTQGFPGWMVFLLWVGFLPAAGFYRSTRHVINWRALAFTLILMTLVSVLWEATLAIPYGWWGYVPEQMVGVFIGAWSNLPIEEPLLWVMISFTTVILYETVKLVLYKRSKTVGEALFGGAGDDDH